MQGLSVAGAVLMLSCAAPCLGADYDLRFAYATDEVFLDGRGERQLGEGAGVTLNAARGEYESFQLVVVPSAEDLREVGVRFEDLTGPDGSRLAATNLSWRQVGYLFCREHTHYDFPGEDWYADPLLESESCSVAAGDHQPLWVTVGVPADQAPGVYKGSLRVVAANAPDAAVPLQVTVWPVTIPFQSSIPMAFTVGTGPHEAGWQRDISTFFPGHEQNFEFRKMTYDFMLKYRISPDHLYLKQPRPMEDYEYLIANGASCFNLLCVPDFGGGPRREEPSEERIQAALDALEPYVTRIRELGAMDRAYVYGIDELGTDLKSIEQKWFHAVHERYPDLKTCQTSGWMDLDVECDIFCPLLSVYSAKRNEPVRQAGRKVWWYTCIGPKHPYPNWFIEYPVIEARIVGWMTYQWRADGYLYYATNLWANGGNTGPMPPGPRCDWNANSWRKANGDGCIYYPGEKGPLATTRLENIRDGFEDYELFRLLDETYGAIQTDLVQEALPTGRGQQVCLQIIDKRDQYSRDSQALRRARIDALRELAQVGQAPRLAVTSPGKEWVTYDETFTVRGVAQPGSGVKINGQPAKVEGARFSLPVPLQMGENTLTVSASSPGGQTKELAYRLIRREPGYTPPGIKAEQTRAGALIDDCADSAGWQLFGAAKDALSIEAALLEGRQAIVASYDQEASRGKRASIGRRIPLMGRRNVGVHLWVWADGSGIPMTVELCEKDWPNWTHTLTLDWEGWKQIKLTWEDFPGGNHNYSRDEKPDWDTIFWFALTPRTQDAKFAISDLRFLVPR